LSLSHRPLKKKHVSRCTCVVYTYTFVAQTNQYRPHTTDNGKSNDNKQSVWNTTLSDLLQYAVGTAAIVSYSPSAQRLYKYLTGIFPALRWLRSTRTGERLNKTSMDVPKWWPLPATTTDGPHEQQWSSSLTDAQTLDRCTRDTKPKWRLNAGYMENGGMDTTTTARRDAINSINTTTDARFRWIS